MFSSNRSAPGDDLIVDKGADDWSAFGDPRRTIGPKGRADMEMDIAITQMTKAARARAGKGSFCRLACIDHEGRHPRHRNADIRSEEHQSELQSLMRISYAVFCLKKKNHPH